MSETISSHQFLILHCIGNEHPQTASITFTNTEVHLIFHRVDPEPALVPAAGDVKRASYPLPTISVDNRRKAIQCGQHGRSSHNAHSISWVTFLQTDQSKRK